MKNSKQPESTLLRHPKKSPRSNISTVIRGATIQTIVSNLQKISVGFKNFYASN